LLASESLKARMGGTCQGGAPYGRTTLIGGRPSVLSSKKSKQKRLN